MILNHDMYIMNKHAQKIHVQKGCCQMKTLKDWKAYKEQTQMMLEICTDPSSQEDLKERLVECDEAIAALEQEEKNNA